MNAGWTPRTILRVASLIAPAGQRAAWLEEWRSELWYVSRNEANRFCLGAFQDALWLRRHGQITKRTQFLESPFRCLAFLAVLSVAGILIALTLPERGTFTVSGHLRLRDLPQAALVMLFYTVLLLPVTRMAMGRPPVDGYPSGWPSRVRGWLFFALKLTLLQPILFCGFILLTLFGPLPITPLAVCVGWMLGFRWLLMDQRRRCPVCLRLLTNPVRIGTPSETFLHWYGAESMCPRGHGLLQVPEAPASYSGSGHWLRLGKSWSSLFSPAAGGRQ